MIGRITKKNLGVTHVRLCQKISVRILGGVPQCFLRRVAEEILGEFLMESL